MARRRGFAELRKPDGSRAGTTGVAFWDRLYAREIRAASAYNAALSMLVAVVVGRPTPRNP
jgi:hypothetical protein